MFSRRVREIFGSYTEQVKPFGLDEAWLDVTGSVIVRGDGEFIANKIQQRVKRQVRFGVSFLNIISHAVVSAKSIAFLQIVDQTKGIHLTSHAVVAYSP